MNGTQVTIHVDGETTGFGGFLYQDRVLAPLEILADRLGAEIESPDGLPHPTICRGELCIPLNVGGREDLLTVDGTDYVYLDELEDPLGLQVRHEENRVMVNNLSTEYGLSPGETPPPFALPDLFTGESVASTDFLGKKVVFYMWASW